MNTEKSAIDKLLQEMIEYYSCHKTAGKWLLERCEKLAAEEKAKAVEATAEASLFGIPVIESKILPEGKAYLMVQDKGLVKQLIEVSTAYTNIERLVAELREEMVRNSDSQSGAIQCWMIEEILAKYDKGGK